MEYYLNVLNDKIISYSQLPVEECYNLSVTRVTYEDYIKNPTKYYVKNNELCVKTLEEIEAERQAQFDKEFFKTSLGYVRRNVSMKTGETKDFLADILPVLEVGVPIIFYDRDLNQSKKMVTEVFLAECKEQILKDFWGE